MYKLIIFALVILLFGGCFRKKWKQKTDVVNIEITQMINDENRA